MKSSIQENLEECELCVGVVKPRKQKQMVSISHSSEYHTENLDEDEKGLNSVFLIIKIQTTVLCFFGTASPDN